MSQRTTVAAVEKLLGGNWDKKTDVQPFIDSASPIVDECVSQSSRRRTPNTLSPALQELIERWLACHFYAQVDQLYGNKSTDKASAGFQGQTAMDLDSTNYGRTAMNLDITGSLRVLAKRQVAGGFWLGKPPSAQIPYNQRN